MPAGVAAALAGLCGFAGMAIELTAVRVLAPHFGDSAFVWTNVIGVMLAALAGGALIGGRLADGGHGRRALAMLFAMAGVLTALAPWLARPLGAWLLPQDLPLDAAMPAMIRGSLAATLLLFGLPALLLGAFTPLLTTLAVRQASIGRTLGAISAGGTTGSLLGTFAATHYLVPGLGCRATLWTCALLLLAAAAWLWPRRGTAAVGLLVLLAWPWSSAPLRPVGADQELLAEVESKYQFLQVVRHAGGAEAGMVALKINEGLDSFHSVRVPGGEFTNGRYYDFHALAPLLAGDGRVPEPLAVLSVGDAAGTFQRLLAARYPGCRVDAVELDPAVVALGDAHFGGRLAAGRTHAGVDGRWFVANSRERWHAVLVDAYAHQVYIPAHLASREFFVAVHERLQPGGICAINVGGLHFRDPVLEAIAGTMATVFGPCHALQVPNSRNFLLVGRRERPLDRRVLADAQLPDGTLSPADRAAWANVLAVGREDRNWHQYEPGKPLVDDRPALDHLLERSYLAADTDATLTVCKGAEAPEAAEAAAHQALRDNDPLGALAAAQSSRAPTPYLRLVCGDSRWRLRNLQGALAEYAAGLAADPAPAADLRDTMLGRQQALQADIGLQQHAVAMRTRNGWLAALGALLLAAVVWAGYRMSRMPAAPSLSVSTAAR